MDSKRKIKYLIIISKKVDQEDDQKTDGGTENNQILMDEKIKYWIFRRYFPVVY
jgi:hypothetical protein